MIALLLSLALAGSTQADEPRREVQTGSRIAKQTREQREQQEVRLIQAAYGKCVVKKQYAAARSYVLAPELEGADQRRAILNVGDSACLIAATTAIRDVEMRFPGDTMRYTLADALVGREFAGGAPGSLKEAPPIPQPVLDESKYVPKPGKKASKRELDELADDRSRQATRVFLAQFGECVVRTDTGNSHALLAAEPDSPQEGAAFAKLRPTFSGCLTAGQSLAFNRATLRGTVAMNFYRLANAARATVPAGASK